MLNAPGRPVWGRRSSLTSRHCGDTTRIAFRGAKHAAINLIAHAGRWQGRTGKPMTQAFSIRRATLQDVETLVSLRLKLQQESGHLTEGQALSDLRRATQQYLLEALPTEAFLVW